MWKQCARSLEVSQNGVLFKIAAWETPSACWRAILWTSGLVWEVVNIWVSWTSVWCNPWSCHETYDNLAPSPKLSRANQDQNQSWTLYAHNVHNADAPCAQQTGQDQEELVFNLGADHPFSNSYVVHFLHAKNWDLGPSWERSAMTKTNNWSSCRNVHLSFCRPNLMAPPALTGFCSLLFCSSREGTEMPANPQPYTHAHTHTRT